MTEHRTYETEHRTFHYLINKNTVSDPPVIGRQKIFGDPFHKAWILIRGDNYSKSKGSIILKKIFWHKLGKVSQNMTKMGKNLQKMANFQLSNVRKSSPNIKTELRTFRTCVRPPKTEHRTHRTP